RTGRGWVWVWSRGRVSLDAHPVVGAVCVLLPLPDGHAGLDAVDQLRTRGERLAPVRRGRHDDQRIVTHRKAAHTVPRPQAHIRVVAVGLVEHLGEDAVRIRVGRVLEDDNTLAPAVVVADDAA